MKLKSMILTLGMLCLILKLNAQTNNVGINNNNPDSSAILDITAADKGILIPRMTTKLRNLISSPATGLMVYDTDVSAFFFYNGNAWEKINSKWKVNGNNIYYSTGNLGIGTTNPQEKLHVNGRVRVNSLTNNTNRSKTIVARPNGTLELDTQTYRYTLNPYDFKGIRSSWGYEVGSNGVHGIDFGWIAAPIHLPHNAKIKNIVINYLDNDQTGNINFILSNRPIGIPNNSISLLDVFTSNASNTLRTITSPILNHVVNNDTEYLAFLAHCGSGWNRSVKIQTVIINYTLN